MHASLNCATQVSQDNKDRDKEKKQHDKTVVFAYNYVSLEPIRQKGSWEYCCRRHDIDIKSDDESEETVTASKL